MTASSDARIHVAKAGEFLEAAQANLGLKLYNAATSDAIISGINSKDVICLVLTGRTTKSDNHAGAVAELRGAGRAGATLAPTLNRLLRLKTKSQYTPTSVGPSDAARAVEWAHRMLSGATDTLAGG